jgi:hypothetical protein
MMPSTPRLPSSSAIAKHPALVAFDATLYLSEVVVHSSQVARLECERQGLLEEHDRAPVLSQASVGIAQVHVRSKLDRAVAHFARDYQPGSSRGTRSRAGVLYTLPSQAVGVDRARLNVTVA